MPDVLTTCQLSSKLIDVPPPTKKMEAILFPFYHLFFLSVRHSRWRPDFWSDDDKAAWQHNFQPTFLQSVVFFQKFCSYKGSIPIFAHSTNVGR